MEFSFCSLCIWMMMKSVYSTTHRFPSLPAHNEGHPCNEELSILGFPHTLSNACPCALFKSCSADRIIKLLTTSSMALITALFEHFTNTTQFPFAAPPESGYCFYQRQAKMQRAQRWKRLLIWLCFHSAIDCMSKVLIPAGREHTIFLQVINNTRVKFKAPDTKKGISSWGK